MSTELRVDEEFHTAIPPLRADERQQLEANLLAHGCRDALVVWAETSILLDGHNRYAICQAHDIPFQTAAISLPDRDAALDWIDRNQLGRRNLTPDQASLLRGRIYNRMKKREGAPYGNTHAGKQLPQNEAVVPERTSERLAAQHGVSRATVERDGAFARAIETLKPIAPELEEAVLTGHAPTKAIVLEAAALAATTPEHAVALLSQTKHIHRTGFTGDHEWYTPAEYLDRARRVLTRIDLDPASSAVAQETVKAATYFTSDMDGLARPWHGRIWLNPPYSQPLIEQFIAKLLAELEAERVLEAIVLTNNSTDTAWFHRAARAASVICFTRGRIRFVSSTKEVAAPTQGQAFFYFGFDRARFCRHFWDVGFIVQGAQSDLFCPLPMPRVSDHDL